MDALKLLKYRHHLLSSSTAVVRVKVENLLLNSESQKEDHLSDTGHESVKAKGRAILSHEIALSAARIHNY